MKLSKIVEEWFKSKKLDKHFQFRPETHYSHASIEHGLAILVLIREAHMEIGKELKLQILISSSICRDI